MLNPVKPGLSFSAPKQAAPLRFQGHREYEQFRRELEAFPDESLARLDEIKNIQGPRHIRVARDYAKADPNVRKINHYIDQFINQRQQESHQHKETSFVGRLFSRATDYLGLTTPKPTGVELLADLRKAIGEVLDAFNAKRQD